MDLGIGLPSTIPGVSAGDILEWARRADRRGFSTLGTIDRLVYGNTEPLVTLGAAAAVTERIRLTTAILLAPLRVNAALLAKQTATVDHLSGGRLVLGLAVGARQDDFEASEADFHHRGRVFDRQLERMRRIWDGEPQGYAGAVGPPPARPGGPHLILGGTSAASMRRVAAYGEGWIAGGGGPGMFEQGARAAREAWSAAGREGEPRLAALGYFALGPDAKRHADSYLHDYYGFLGPIADQIAGGALTSDEAVAEAMTAFERAGCDELILFPCSPDPDQVDLLAAAGLS